MLYGRLPLAVATNASISKRSMVEMALRRVGLAKYFDEIFCYTDLGYRKDQRQFWDAVETGLRVPKSQIAMVGDSYEQDALAPRLFGVQGVWLNRGVAPQSERSASPVTDSLGEFSRWVLSAT